MPWKDKEKQREAIRKHYYANKEEYIKRALKRRTEVRLWLNELKAETPCKDCGVSYPYYVMDFDHIGAKTHEINRLVIRGNSKQLREEISRCEIVCSNCHRKRTYRRIQEK